MRQDEFSILVERIVLKIREFNEAGKFFIGSLKPADFEKIVVEASKIVLQEQEIACQVEYEEGSHVFPDVIFKFISDCGEQRYGIEVKSSVSKGNSWSTLGNSILGTTSQDVLDTHLIFIKWYNNKMDIRSKRYEDAVENVVVTHSPRYKINLDIEPNQSFFAKSGISYQQMKDSEDSIGLVTNYFRQQNQTAWWMSAPPSDGVLVDSAAHSSAIIKFWSDLSVEETKEIMARIFILFPELWGRSPTKLKAIATWLVVNYSVVNPSLRDVLSAGGQVSLNLGNEVTQALPKVFSVFYSYAVDFLSWFNRVSVQELGMYWTGYDISTDTEIARKEFWRHQLSKHLDGEQMEIINKILNW